MPAIPLVVAGVTSAVSAYGAHKQAKAAGEASKATQDIANQQSQLAKEIMSFGKGQVEASQPALNKAMQYYMQLAGGNRGMMGAALGPDTAALTDTYSGAQRGIESQMGQGPQRDRAVADLQRQKAGQMGLMPMMARSNAVAQLANQGTANMLGQAYGLGQEGRNAWNDLGGSIWKTFGPWLMEKYGGGGKSKSGGGGGF